MNEHPEVMEAYAQMGKEEAVDFTFHLSGPNGHKVAHGDVVDISCMATDSDGAVVDVFYPEKPKATVNLWVTNEQTASFLTWIVRTWQPLQCLETGTNRGRSTKAISEALTANGAGHLWTIDMADHGVGDRYDNVNFIVGATPGALSKMPQPLALEFAYLDGAHTLEVLEEEIMWVKCNVSPRGCYICVDDAANEGWPEVGEVVREYGGFTLPTPHGLGIIFMEGN